MVRLDLMQMKKMVQLCSPQKTFLGLVLAGVIVLGSSFVFAQTNERPELPEQMVEETKEPILKQPLNKPLPREKTSLGLIDKALKEGKIDDDTALLYKVYLMNRLYKLLPEEFGSEQRGFGDIIIEDLWGEVPQKWNKLRPEIKKKIKEAYWQNSFNEYPSRAKPEIVIESPKENDVVNSAEIVVKGMIFTPPIYNLVGSWIEVAEKRFDLTVSPPVYKPVNWLEDKLYRKKYFDERYKDTPELMEFLVPLNFVSPPKHETHFVDRISLPNPGIYQVNITAVNSYENEHYNKTTETVWIVYPPKEKKDNEPPKIEIEGVLDGQEFKEIPYQELLKGVTYGPIKFKYKDESSTLACVYANDDKVHYGSPYNFSLEREETYYLTGIGDFLRKEGINIIKVIATDSYGNTSTKEIKLILLKDKK